MADYKRMVSYMYQYENGIKRKNVGYTRIEAKNGQVKITLHMQLLGQIDSIFPTYLIQRDENGIDLIYLGDTILKSQVMDSKLTAQENNIMNTGHSLSEMGGLLLFMHDNVFFATEWDDKPITATEVLDALKPKKIENSKAEKKVDKNEEELSTAGLTTFHTESDRSERLSPEGLRLAEEIAMPKYKLPRGWKTIERVQRPVSMEPVQETIAINDVDEEEKFQRVKDVNEKKRSEEENNDLYEKEILEGYRLYDTLKNALESENLSNIVSEDDKITEEIQEKNQAPYEEQEQENPVAKNLFDMYPRIYPFEDNEIILCVKIEPKDIGLLPKSLWALSNNSFLMHGYYCYHHLIFAKLKDRYGCRYILGIPGIYHNRERFMARMFGFETFKSIRRRELKQGDFGYWYIDVNF